MEYGGLPKRTAVAAVYDRRSHQPKSTQPNFCFVFARDTEIQKKNLCDLCDSVAKQKKQSFLFQKLLGWLGIGWGSLGKA